MRNFRSNVSIATDTGGGLMGLAAALDRLEADGEAADRSTSRRGSISTTRSAAMR